MVTNRKISASSARSHTRKLKKGNSFYLFSATLKKLLLVLSFGVLAFIYQAVGPPPARTCGSPNGPPVTASRIKLRDGRNLAYKEYGVPKAESKYKFVFVHGFGSCRHNFLRVSQTLIEEAGIYMVSFDRAGYGESDPDPGKTMKSTALDIEELADQLGLGSRFYIVGASMGGQVVWACLKYIPHRLAGAVLIAPVINFWWSSLPANVSQEAFNKQLLQDQWALRVVHYAPWLTYWWNTQRLFPCLGIITKDPRILSPKDREIVSIKEGNGEEKMQATQQGTFESLHRDLMIGFGHWEFEPTDLDNPFPNNEASVHLWQGKEDVLVPASTQRYIANKLPWIEYHEVPDGGHLFILADGYPDAIIKALLYGK